MNEVRTRDEAISMVDHALNAWSTTMSAVLTQAQVVARAACDQVERVLDERRNEVALLEALLSAAQPTTRHELEMKLERARVSRDQAKRAAIQVQDIAASVAQLHRAHTTTTTGQVATARAQLSSMIRALEGYRSSGGSNGTGVSSRSATQGAVVGSGPGLAEIVVSGVELDDNPILDDNGAQGTFGKGGLSRSDYRWAVQTWDDVVGPGVAAGKTRDDFAMRDVASDARPLRRTADVYDMFLGSERIRADRRPDGSLNIINGRHRLLIARELGIKSLPGDVH